LRGSNPPKEGRNSNENTAIFQPSLLDPSTPQDGTPRKPRITEEEPLFLTVPKKGGLQKINAKLHWLQQFVKRLLILFDFERLKESKG